jgi:archaellum component FlaG (FlaF/FlaG flagellin family)
MKTIVMCIVSVIASAALAQQGLKPVNPVKPTVSPKLVPVKPVAQAMDLAIVSADQTGPDFWIIRVKNVGGAASGATTVKLTLVIPGSFTGSPVSIEGMGSAALPAIAPGMMTLINLKTNIKSKGTMQAEVMVNPDKKPLETSYANNALSVKAANY